MSCLLVLVGDVLHGNNWSFKHAENMLNEKGWCWIHVFLILGFSLVYKHKHLNVYI